MKEIGAADRHEVGGRLNNRAENSHQPFRRRERAMQRFRSMKTLQKFGSVHAQVHISIRSGISSPGRFTSRDARLHWRSGAPLPRRASVTSGRVALRVGESRYFDDAVVAHLAGDEAAAINVRLTLPETGVCSTYIAATGEECCGGPAPANPDACCVADATAKAASKAGCGCG
jgi:hypothetical protein